MAMALDKNEERALELAHFLTTFHSFYCAPGESFNGRISPSDIERALDYRHQQKCHYELQNDAQALRREGRMSGERQKELDEKVRDSCKALEASPAIVKNVDNILRRFEVWSTKAIAQQVLVHCGPAPPQSNSDWICSAPLLNLPGPMYFSKVLPMISGRDVEPAAGPNHPRLRLPYNERHPSATVTPPAHSCTLALPPNAWTWEEYARISNMVALLPTTEARDEVLRSTVSRTVPSVMPRPRTTSRDESKLSEQAEISRADLVALWVRSQRNTRALMHLLHLFEIDEVAPDNMVEDNSNKHWRIAKGRGIGGKVLIPRQDDDCDREDSHVTGPDEQVGPLHFEARFVGNHKYSRKLVQESAPLIDELVDWAVTNQFLCTDPYIRQMLGEDEKLNRSEKSKKRARGLQSATRPDETSAKRSKTATDSPDELLLTCQVYVLRWLARRNRDSLSLVFSTVTGSASGVDETRRKKVEAKVSKYISERQGKSMAGNRTLSRIDRRTGMGIFTNKDYPDFRATVVVLLEALQDASVATPAVLKDFLSLYAALLAGKDGKSAAASLVEMSVDASVDVNTILRSVPTPWIDRCSVCSKSFEQSEPSICDLCEMAFHPHCDKEVETRKIAELIALYPPLRGLFPIIVPEAVAAPDFCSGISWRSMEVSVKPNADKRLGLKLGTTGDCESLLERIRLPAPLEELYEKKNTVPLAVPHRGLVIYEVDSDCSSGTRGVQRSDIITAIRCDTETASWQDLRDLSDRERTVLLSRDTEAITLRIQRPDADLIHISREWLSRLKEANADAPRRPRHKRKLRCCSKCQKRGGQMERIGGNLLDTVRKEALWCRAVLRRLGMESFTLPFHEESATNISETATNCIDHSQFVSFRRVDSMMNYILTKGRSATTIEPRCSPFLVPPSTSDTPTGDLPHRLDWAPPELESQPMKLLCTAMRLLTCPVDVSPNRYDQGKNPFDSMRAQLRDHFAIRFTAWCVVSINGSRGPPLYAMCNRPSWLKKSCKVCHSRCASTPNGTCTNRSCSRVLEVCSGAGGLHRDIPVSSARKNSRSMERLRAYNRCSALVGTPFFVPPGDPVLELLSSAVKKPIGTMRRPMGFIIASYLPTGFEGGPHPSSVVDGLFHVLPILSAPQLSYLVRTCKMRCAPVTVSHDQQAWTRLEIFEIPGVLQMTANEIGSLLKKSAAVIEAIGVAVARSACSGDICSPKTVQPVVLEPANQHARQQMSYEAEMWCSLNQTSWTAISAQFRSGDLIPTRLRSASQEREACLTQHALLAENLSTCECQFFRDMVSTVSANLCAEEAQIDATLEGNLAGIDKEHKRGRWMGRHERATLRDSRANLNESVEDIELYAKSYRASLQSSKSFPLLRYVDLVGPTIEDTRAILTHIQDQKLSSPAPLASPSSHTILLDWSSLVSDVNNVSALSVQQFSGRGWGFELIEWPSDGGFLRVGRVHPKSPASVAGLKMNDCIVDIGKRPVCDILEGLNIAAALLHTTTADLTEFSQGSAATMTLRLAKALKSFPAAAELTVVRGTNEIIENTVRTRDSAAIHLGSNNDHSEDQGRPEVAARDTRPQQVHRRSGMTRPDRELGIISPQSLYRHGLPNTPLTQVETSVVWEALARHGPVFARRLLAPRYELRMTGHLVHAVQIAGLHKKFPRLEDDLWSFIVRHDSQRAAHEPASTIIGEENGIRHRQPVEPLPLDRLVESFFYYRENSDPIRGRPAADAFNAISDSECESPSDTLDGQTYSCNIPDQSQSVASTERIREGESRITHLDSSAWDRKIVWGKCRVCLDGNRVSNSYIVGQIRNASTGVATVLVFYCGDVGYLSPSPTYRFAVSKLTVLTGKEPGSSLLLKGWQDRRLPSSDEPEYEGTDRSVLTIEEAGNSLLKWLCRRTCRLMGIGFLPDGSDVCWTRSDPSALYIRTRRNSSDMMQRETRVLFESDSPQNHRISERYYCPWGCSNQHNGVVEGVHECWSRPVPFSTEEDLASHLFESHSYVSLFQNTECLVRLGEGHTICTLAADLTNAVCARCPSLVDFTQNVSVTIPIAGQAAEATAHCTSMKSFTSSILNLTKSGKGAPRSLGPLLAGRRGSSASILSSLNLWSIIFRLFDVQGTGHFRYEIAPSLTSVENEIDPILLEEPQSDNDTSKASLTRTQTHCDFEVEGLNCQLCSMMGEGTMKCFQKRNEIDANGEESRPIGCALYSKVCFPQLSSASQVLQLKSTGKVGGAQAALIHIASAVPQGIRREFSDVRESLWVEDNFMMWRRHVENAQSLHTLKPAYVVLLRSTNKTQLPKWWSDKNSGWHTPSALLCVSSLSALLLHLFVFDLALSEHRGSTRTVPVVDRQSESSIPEGLRGMSLEQRMEAVLAFADDIRYARFQGESNSYCLQCDDGGTLMECEFCENVQHARCSIPSIVDASKISGWVCDSCTTDLWSMKENSTLT